MYIHICIYVYIYIYVYSSLLDLLLRRRLVAPDQLLRQGAGYVIVYHIILYYIVLCKYMLYFIMLHDLLLYYIERPGGGASCTSPLPLLGLQHPVLSKPRR